ncbi:hypothetical protein U9M48_024540 [Paspalum notatum var. saurae]|uniref:Uncharacterized protein n=1 Tax=Paspalum notatum var. saurae TaxID=547442 RepID=A0AAQ3TNC0_PASNO
MTAPFMHIDPAIEEETVQEQPLIEEPEEEQENQQPTADPAAEETNPSEEEDPLATLALAPIPRVHRNECLEWLGVRMPIPLMGKVVRSSSSVPVLVVGRVLIRNEKSHDLARNGISGLDARSIYASTKISRKQANLAKSQGHWPVGQVARLLPRPSDLAKWPNQLIFDLHVPK